MSKKKISEERQIVEKNGYTFETVWETYINVSDSPIDDSDNKKKYEEKLSNKVSTLNNKTSKISKIKNKGIKIK